MTAILSADGLVQFFDDAKAAELLALPSPGEGQPVPWTALPTPPAYNAATHRIEWNGAAWQTVPLTAEQLAALSQQTSAIAAGVLADKAQTIWQRIRTALANETEPDFTGISLTNFPLATRGWSNGRFALDSRVDNVANAGSAHVAETTAAHGGIASQAAHDALQTSATNHANNSTTAHGGMLMQAAERTKLTGIATGATANSTDAQLVNRANHTGTQLKATISDFAHTHAPSDITGTAVITNDARLSDARNPLAHAHTISDVTSLQTVLNALGSIYSTLIEASSSHTAARVAGTYAMANGEAAAISGTGTLYPIAIVQIAAADWPTIGGVAPKLRVRVQLATNDVAPTGTYTFGLHPVTRPATSGGAGLCIYTIGAAVSGSNGATFNAPAADAMVTAVGSDFALPADGLYCIGFVQTGTVAANAHMHISAQLQLHNA